MAAKAHSSIGTCALCYEEFAKTTMRRHLRVCPARQPGNQRRLHLLVEGGPNYWMHVAIQATATLADLDRFLRRAWLECCSHMSAFTIDDQRYSVAPLPEIPEKSMSVRVGEVLKPGSHIRYEYDFGSTTELDLTMMEEWNSKPERQPTQLLALNNPPVYACVHCGKPATLVSADADPEEALLCRRCGKQIGDPDMLLPLVNSPRTGVCAYTGPVVRIMRVPRTNRRAQRVPAEQP